MVDLMVKGALLKALLMCFGFGTPFVCSHDGLIGPFDALVDVRDDENFGCVGGSWYVNG